MKPWQIAQELYGENFFDLIRYCLVYGTVHSDDECFICAWYTDSDFIFPKEMKNNIDKGDTIFVFICVGSLKSAFGHVQKRKFISFERFDGSYRLYDYDRFRRLVWVAA